MVAFSILAIALHYISFCCLFIGVKLLVSVSSVWCVFTEWICRSFALWLWWIFMDLFVHVLHCSWATNGHPRLQLFQPTEVCCTKGWALPRDRWTWRSCWHVALGGRKVGTLKLTSWHHRKMEPGWTRYPADFGCFFFGFAHLRTIPKTHVKEGGWKWVESSETWRPTLGYNVWWLTISGLGRARAGGKVGEATACGHCPRTDFHT